MKTRHLLFAVLRAALLAVAPLALAQQTTKVAGAPRALPTETKPWKGDFDGMVEQRRIRVLVPYSPTLAPGRYARLIAQSAPLFRPPMFVELEAAAEYTAALAAKLGVAVSALRDVDGATLQRAEHAFAASPELAAAMGRPRTAPVRDGKLLRAWPYDAGPARVPVLAGWTRDEANFWFDLRDGDGKVISPLSPPATAAELEQRVRVLGRLHYAFPDAPDARTVLAAYSGGDDPAASWRDLYTDLVFRAPILHFAGRQARAGTPAYVYEFAYPLPAPGRGSPRAADVPFVFGTMGHPHFARKIGGGAAVPEISRAMMTAWASFARHGVPDTGGQDEWSRFDPRSPRVMQFGPERAGPAPLARAQALDCWPAYRA